MTFLLGFSLNFYDLHRGYLQNFEAFVVLTAAARFVMAAAAVSGARRHFAAKVKTPKIFNIWVETSKEVVKI